MIVALAALAMAGMVVATAIAQVDPPPTIAFVARGDGSNFADALAVGSIAGQLGAPVFTTPSSRLADDAATGLAALGPDMVVLVGGTAALSEQVQLDVLEATGLAFEDVQRVAGSNRYATASAIATLLDDLGLSQAFVQLGTTVGSADRALEADDADLLDGLDSSAFARAPVPTEQVLACGGDEFQVRPAEIREFWQDPDNSDPDYVTYNYDPDGWGVNAYQYPEDTSLRCIVHLPTASQLVGIEIPARDSAGYDLLGCSARLQDFSAEGDTMTEFQREGETDGTPGNFTIDLSPASPVAVHDAAVLSVDCGFSPMTGGPRDLGYRGVRVTILTDSIP